MRRNFLFLLSIFAIILGTGGFFFLNSSMAPWQSFYSSEAGINIGAMDMMSMMGRGMGGMMGMMMSGFVGAGQKPISSQKAKALAKNYLNLYNNPHLEIEEALEFSQNFYFSVKEKNTGIRAFEFLVDRYQGTVFPEPGPNMMWNLKYGGGSMTSFEGRIQSQENVKLPITKGEAKIAAQEFLESFLPGAVAEDPEKFYGYYTLEFKKDRRTLGMISVNGFSGELWYHSWHGFFVRNIKIDNS